MTSKLPPNLLALFAPRPSVRYLPPTSKALDDVKPSHISGVAQYVEDLKKYDQEVPYEPTECWLQRKARLKEEKREKLKQLLTEGASEYNPSEDSQARGDPFRTLFVARLSYDITVQDLEREFGRYGPIERIRIVEDTHNPKADSKKKNRGYAFIVYEREKDMKAAYKETDGLRIKDRRVLVDVERGRTVKGWKPRRFGGGLGGRGYTKTAPARPMGGPAGFAPTGPGFRGGFGGRGGFRGGFNRDFGGRGGGGGGPGGPGGFGARNGFGGFGGNAPPNAPSGPGAGRSAGYGGFGGGGVGGGASGAGGAGGGGFDDRRGGGRFERGITGGNREPIRPRESYDRGGRDRDRGGDHSSYRDRDRHGGGHRDRDYRDRGDRDRRDRDRYGSRRDDDYSRKRYRDDTEYDDPRTKRRY